MNEVVAKKRSYTPLLLILVFVLPVILAKLALDNDWFNRGATNKGELLAEGHSLTALSVSLEPKWRILYRLPANCEDSCENTLYIMNQIWLALGRESDRVEPLVLVDDNSQVNRANELAGHETIKLLRADERNVNNVFKDVPADGIFLVDTLGNLVLRYSTQQEQQQAVLQSRDILADLRKLLKLSKIG